MATGGAVAERTGRAERAKFVTDLRGLIRNSSGMLFADLTGLDSEETFALRKAMRPSGAKLKVVKNRLMKIACREESVAVTEGWLKSNTTVVFAGEDLVSAVKAVTTYAADHDKVKIKGAMIEGKAVGLAEVKALAALPGRRELLTMAAVMMKAPLSRGARDFKEMFRKMAVLLGEAAKKAPKA